MPGIAGPVRPAEVTEMERAADSPAMAIAGLYSPMLAAVPGLALRFSPACAGVMRGWGV